MSRRVILSPDAEAEIIAIQRWYRSKEASLAFAFKVELRLTLRLIAQYPYAFTVVKKGIRRALIKGFPYLIFFRLKTGSVSVIAVVHERRKQRF